MITLTFLGTSSMIPTAQRNPIAMLIQIQGENILIDCGEGTQRQLQLAGVSPQKINKIFISHWHGDHVLGLPGLLQTINSENKKEPIEIYGPKGTKRFLDIIQKTFILQRGNIKLKVNEIIKAKEIKFDSFSIDCKELNHVVPCMGYSFKENDKRKINSGYLKKFGLKTHPLIGELQRGKDIIYNNKKISHNKATYIKKGKKITFILDTRFVKDLANFAKNSDILVCESTFLSNLKQKAFDYKHLTAKQAADIAKNSKSKKLILTHFSQRYKDTNPMQKEARNIFKNTICAHDLLKIEL